MAGMRDEIERLKAEADAQRVRDRRDSEEAQAEAASKREREGRELLTVAKALKVLRDMLVASGRSPEGRARYSRADRNTRSADVRRVADVYGAWAATSIFDVRHLFRWDPYWHLGQRFREGSGSADQGKVYETHNYITKSGKLIGEHYSLPMVPFESISDVQSAARLRAIGAPIVLVSDIYWTAVHYRLTWPEAAPDLEGILAGG